MTKDQLIWVIGAAERLASLGVFHKNIPVRIPSESVEHFMQLDENRNTLFSSDVEVAMIFAAIAESESSESIPEDEMNYLIHYILEYKNNRTELMREALQLSYA